MKWYESHRCDKISHAVCILYTYVYWFVTIARIWLYTYVYFVVISFNTNEHLMNHLMSNGNSNKRSNVYLLSRNRMELKKNKFVCRCEGLFFFVHYFTGRCLHLIMLCSNPINVQYAYYAYNVYNPLLKMLGWISIHCLLFVHICYTLQLGSIICWGVQTTKPNSKLFFLR